MDNSKETKQKGVRRGGRQKGSENVITREVRLMIKDFVDNNMETFIQRMNALDEVNYCRTFVAILPYCAPRLQSVQFKDQTIKVKTIEDKLVELSKADNNE